jgi:L-threonylcarbamoyladenylate synthase
VAPPEILPAERGSLERAAAILTDGGLVIVPTETFYGIACDARDQGALTRLTVAKGRAEGKPLPLIAPDLETVLEYVRTEPDLLAPLADRFWPGPLTLVLPAGTGFPGEITAGTGTVGVRVPAPCFALDLARAFGGPITATSANPAGQPPPQSVPEIDSRLGQEVDLIIDGGTTPGGLPSTVLDLTADPPVIVRKGILDGEVGAFLERLARKA